MFTSIIFIFCRPTQRHFSVFALPFPGNDALTTIYSSILSQHLQAGEFSAAVQKSCSTLVSLALAMHQGIFITFLLSAVKFHYIFNLRDISNIFQVRHGSHVQMTDMF